MISVAQDNGLNLTEAGEYDLGFKCPVASTLDPSGEVIWILMNNCGASGFTLHAYNIVDGSQINTDDYAETLSVLSGADIFGDLIPMAFTPGGDLSIRFNDFETEASSNLIIPLDGGEATLQTNPEYDALLIEYTEYPTFAVYSEDHTRVMVVGNTGFYTLDLQTQTEIAQIPGDEYAYAAFSSDGERVIVTRFNNPDDLDDFTSSLSIYSLPDGDLIDAYQVPSPALWMSPDGRYAAVILFSNVGGERNELIIVDLETGSASSPLNLDEEPKPVTQCVNSGNDVSGLGYVASGSFSVPSVHWLPDSSGLVVPLSFGGDAAQSGDILCFFDYSRLRTYNVEIAD